MLTVTTIAFLLRLASYFGLRDSQSTSSFITSNLIKANKIKILGALGKKNPGIPGFLNQRLLTRIRTQPPPNKPASKVAREVGSAIKPEIASLTAVGSAKSVNVPNNAA